MSSGREPMSPTLAMNRLVAYPKCATESARQVQLLPIKYIRLSFRCMAQECVDVARDVKVMRDLGCVDNEV
jgi:hypothetical protein